MARRPPLIVGLDVGTYKVGAIVAELTEQGTEIVGIGSSASKGLRKGVVVNSEATVEAIRKATEEAELMAGCEIRSVIVGSAGNHIKGFNSHGVVAVKSREVGGGDVERVLDAARAIALPVDRQVLHVLPQGYIVDDQDGSPEPVSMAGGPLAARGRIGTRGRRPRPNPLQRCQPHR